MKCFKCLCMIFLYIVSKNWMKVSKNNTSIENMVDRFGRYFHKILLQKIVCRKLDYTNDNDRKRYCFCKHTGFSNMIACENSTCPYEPFHYCCVGIACTPQGWWVCSECMKEQNDKWIVVADFHWNIILMLFFFLPST